MTQTVRGAMTGVMRRRGLLRAIVAGVLVGAGGAALAPSRDAAASPSVDRPEMDGEDAPALTPGVLDRIDWSDGVMGYHLYGRQPFYSDNRLTQGPQTLIRTVHFASNGAITVDEHINWHIDDYPFLAFSVVLLWASGAGERSDDPVIATAFHAAATQLVGGDPDVDYAEREAAFRRKINNLLHVAWPDQWLLLTGVYTRGEIAAIKRFHPADVPANLPPVVRGILGLQ